MQLVPFVIEQGLLFSFRDLMRLSCALCLGQVANDLSAMLSPTLRAVGPQQHVYELHSGCAPQYAVRQ